MVNITSLLAKAGSGVGFSFGVKAWTEMEIRCIKGMYRVKLISSANNLGFKGLANEVQNVLYKKWSDILNFFSSFVLFRFLDLVELWIDESIAIDKLLLSQIPRYVFLFLSRYTLILQWWFGRSISHATGIALQEPPKLVPHYSLVMKLWTTTLPMYSVVLYFPNNQLA